MKITKLNCIRSIFQSVKMKEVERRKLNCKERRKLKKKRSEERRSKIEQIRLSIGRFTFIPYTAMFHILYYVPYTKYTSFSTLYIENTTLFSHFHEIVMNGVELDTSIANRSKSIGIYSRSVAQPSIPRSSLCISQYIFVSFTSHYIHLYLMMIQEKMCSS